MKYFLLMLGMVCSLVLVASAFADAETASRGDFKLTIASAKETYKLGEVLEFKIDLKNESNSEVQIGIFGVGPGYLHLSCSKDNVIYTNCDDFGWGAFDGEGGGTPLKPNGVAKAVAKILCTLKQGAPEFRFTEPGKYYVKAIYGDYANGLESLPVQIHFEQPVGDDLRVWDKIKGDGNVAYLLQNSDLVIPSFKPEERTKFLNEIEKIISEYPNSVYADMLQHSLEEFLTREGKVRRFKQNLEKQKPNQ